MNKKSHFSKLKKAWGLDESTSLEDLLDQAQIKLKTDPENPELSFNVAELLRHQNRNTEASQLYKEAIKQTDTRTEARMAKLDQRVKKQRTSTRNKFLFFTFAPLIIAVILGLFAWKILNEPEKLPADSDPEKFAFTQWLAKQQMAEIMTTLQQQNPELSFDFSSSSANSQTPMEFMQSLMQADAIEQMRRDKQRKDNDQANEGEGRPAFQCSKEPAVMCTARDIPNAAGESREEVVLLMEAYNSILNNEKDCEKIEKSIETIGEQLQWRKSERRIKANLEDLAVECFYRKNDLEKTIEHARKLQCTGDESYINSVYWYMTAINHRVGDKSKAFSSYQCFQEATDYISEYDFSPAYIASRHRESGALAWLYFDDLEAATSALIKGRKILKSIPDKSAAMLQVISEIDLDLMETYVTANIDKDTFDSLLEEINSSGLLTDGYKQIKDTLAAIYHMQNNNNADALIPLTNMTSRFGLMPEFICGWDWSGFERGLEESISNNEIREQAINLVNAANCYVPQAMEERIQKVNRVSQWLRTQ